VNEEQTWRERHNYVITFFNLFGLDIRIPPVPAVVHVTAQKKTGPLPSSTHVSVTGRRRALRACASATLAAREARTTRKRDGKG